MLLAYHDDLSKCDSRIGSNDQIVSVGAVNGADMLKVVVKRRA